MNETRGKMRSFKILIIVWGIFLVCATPSFAQKFKPGSEPDGFRGIKWGTALSSLSGMLYSHTRPRYGIKVYLRNEDELTIGRAKLKRIEYWFWKEKFARVCILTEGLSNFSALKLSVFEKFGQVETRFYFVPEEFIWFGKQAYMLLKYNEFSEQGQLIMVSEKIEQEIEAEDREKAKEGAKKGF